MCSLLFFLKLIFSHFSIYFYVNQNAKSECYIYAIEFKPCLHALKNHPCNMTYRVHDFAQNTAFQCNGSLMGVCFAFGCSAKMLKDWNNEAHIRMPSRLYTTDKCTWCCTYGTSQSSYFIKIFSKYTEI